MAVSVGACYFIFPPIGASDGKTVMHDSILGALPAIFTGNGTVVEDIAPFVNVGKGSMYIQADADDNAEMLFVKVDDANAGDETDWQGVTISTL